MKVRGMKPKLTMQAQFSVGCFHFSQRRTKGQMLWFSTLLNSNEEQHLWRKNMNWSMHLFHQQI